MCFPLGMETSQIAHRYNLVEWALDERLRRLIFAAEAKVLGHCRITVVAAATGISRRAIHTGLKELESRQTINQRTLKFLPNLISPGSTYLDPGQFLIRFQYRRNIPFGQTHVLCGDN